MSDLLVSFYKFSIHKSKCNYLSKNLTTFVILTLPKKSWIFGTQCPILDIQVCNVPINNSGLYDLDQEGQSRKDPPIPRLNVRRCAVTKCPGEIIPPVQCTPQKCHYLQAEQEREDGLHGWKIQEHNDAS